jgi:predicted ribosomally synthesized peptide with SipW-like signal peptide
MKRIIIGLLLIAGAGAVIVSGATGAFFSDTEQAIGNTFAAGDIDLKVDNESYYNRSACLLGDWDNNAETPATYAWQGQASYPVPGTPCTTSWEISDLGKGLLFFNFTDIKPDDEGEDTISLHAGSNDAYACMDVTLTSNDDKSSTEPELQTPDAQENINNTWDGELAQNVQMFWWADDGDNVFEVGENQLAGGINTLYNLASANGGLYSVPLADAVTNVWTPATPGPITGDSTVYLGKVWCFGTLALAPVAQDGQGKLPGSTNGPIPRGTGVTCDGTKLNNLTQTDSATLDVAFRAVQARHNGTFTCKGTDPRLAKLTVVKKIVNDNGGNNIVSDFQLFVVGTVVTPVTSNVTTVFPAGNYTITESGIQGYQASFSGDCNVAGQVTLAPGDNKTCIITNNDIPPSITLIKNVVGGTALPIQFTMKVDGNVVPQNTSVPLIANNVHVVSEDPFLGYTLTSVTGSGCPATLPANITLNEGQAIICTVTNTAI